MYSKSVSLFFFLACLLFLSSQIVCLYAQEEEEAKATGAEISEPDTSEASIFKTLELHKQNSFITTWRQNKIDPEEMGDRREEEVRIQISFKKRLLELFPLYFAYSHKAFWQIYNERDSRPFREHNYNPEFFLQYEKLWLFDQLLLGIWEHESNGEQKHYNQDGELVNYSRSWNRVYVFPKISFLDNQALIGVKLWMLVSSDRSTFEEDNGDIAKYMGNGELILRGKTKWNRLDFLFRRGWNAGTETYQLDYHLSLQALSSDLFKNSSYLYFYFFSGYGESLIDYNRKIVNFGIGFSIE